MTADELLSEIEASRPVGYFAAPGVRALLVRYTALLSEHHAVHQRLRRTRRGSKRSLELTIEAGHLIDEICQIAEFLHICPGDRDLGWPPPRLQ